jgi:hypothetical protein
MLITECKSRHSNRNQSIWFPTSANRACQCRKWMSQICSLAPIFIFILPLYASISLSFFPLISYIPLIHVYFYVFPYFLISRLLTNLNFPFVLYLILSLLFSNSLHRRYFLAFFLAIFLSSFLPSLTFLHFFFQYHQILPQKYIDMANNYTACSE